MRGKIGDNVLFLAHRHGIELEGVPITADHRAFHAQARARPPPRARPATCTWMTSIWTCSRNRPKSAIVAVHRAADHAGRRTCWTWPRCSAATADSVPPCHNCSIVTPRRLPDHAQQGARRRDVHAAGHHAQLLRGRTHAQGPLVYRVPCTQPCIPSCRSIPHGIHAWWGLAVRGRDAGYCASALRRMCVGAPAATHRPAHVLGGWLACLGSRALRTAPV